MSSRPFPLQCLPDALCENYEFSPGETPARLALFFTHVLERVSLAPFAECVRFDAAARSRRYTLRYTPPDPLAHHWAIGDRRSTLLTPKYGAAYSYSYVVLVRVSYLFEYTSTRADLCVALVSATACRRRTWLLSA